MNTISYRNLHFPSSIIQYAVWLYARFNLSLRDVEELLAERGIEVSYETIRRWVIRFGPQIARRLRRGRPRAHPQWHLDEMYVSIGGRWMYLWRAIDREGEVFDVLVQTRRDKRSALKSMRRLLNKHGSHRERSSPTNGGPMRQRFVIWVSTPGITRRSGRITGSKDRMCGSDGESGRCKGFDLPGPPSAFFRSMPLSTTISQRADISSQPPNIATVVIKRSRYGAPLPAPLPDGMLRWA